MSTRPVVRPRHWLLVVWLVSIWLTAELHVPVATAQGQTLRLGEMRVDWYCLQRGYSAWVTNNGADWACTTTNGSVALILSQSDYNVVCQTFYNNSAAFAVRDRNSSVPALDWSCVALIPPTLTPTAAPVATRLGDFQVEWYCHERGDGVQVINNQSDWACTQPSSNQIAFVLGQDDFNRICQRTYNNPSAYAVRDQNKPEPAYNWSCYVDLAVLPTPVPLPSVNQPDAACNGQNQWFFTFAAGAGDSGCPGPVITSPALGQNFQGGRVVRYDPLPGQPQASIYVIYNDMTWTTYPDTWTPDQPLNDPRINPPLGWYQPTGAIGKVWREQPGVRDKLGWAYAPEAPFTGRRQSSSTGLHYIDHGLGHLVLRLDETNGSATQWTVVGSD